MKHKNNELNVKIYEDTLSKSRKYESGKTCKHFFNGKFDIVDNKKGEIKVLPLDSVTAGEYFNVGKTCILNMASYKRPGGGVERGSNAQEECLFRCSNLGLSISPNFYPLKQDEALYTQDATFIKDFHYKDITPFVCDVLTIAAVNLNSTFLKQDDYIELTFEKINFLFKIARNYKVDNLILGAWGCGVFKNDPEFMADSFKKVLEQYRSGFENIVFAVINDHNSVANNYEIFKKHLG